MGGICMFPEADVTTSRYDALAAYLQKFVSNTADHLQLLEIVGETQAALSLRQYFEDNQTLLKARDRYKSRFGKKVFTPDDFEEYIFLK